MKLRNLFAALAIAASLVVATGFVGSTPAYAWPTTCSWETFGEKSNCDDLYPYEGVASDCALDGMTKLSADLSMAPRIQVSLQYSRKCRSVWATLYYDNSRGAPGNCYVKIERNYGSHKALYAGAAYSPNGFYYAYTNMLYDANVTSFAWAHCEVNGVTYRGGTGSY